MKASQTGDTDRIGAKPARLQKYRRLLAIIFRRLLRWRNRSKSKARSRKKIVFLEMP